VPAADETPDDPEDHQAERDVARPDMGAEQLLALGEVERWTRLRARFFHPLPAAADGDFAASVK
jgi:hypothetical protein